MKVLNKRRDTSERKKTFFCYAFSFVLFTFHPLCGK